MRVRQCEGGCGEGEGPKVGWERGRVWGWRRKGGRVGVTCEGDKGDNIARDV